ncbi:winged helix-turn-helix transcriptional regulator [Natronosporangium hydrolyticum]|uniref:Winged helix-turn-helix transcriptional regulator n=1 Tax=Natronosporangium hydrolyticum TaxID=2811111 RepID=A0A895YN86_9ACTN|nr:metalloregulator ArsR/SmtB family transcription factor [Natronosporangium hydrolyticum]QSB15388.1 winged helix-turn-helix transcriptional regulator [Natronosporangium hydrolyticum]
MSTPPASIVEICSALGDDTRWEILRRLAVEPASASALAARLPVTRQAIARHLDVLREAGLVERERDGREVRYRALGATLNDAAAQLQAVADGWDRRLAALRRLAED